MSTYEKYIKEWSPAGFAELTGGAEELTDDDLVSDMLSQEDIYKLKIMSVRAGVPLPVIVRAVEKVYKGVTVSAEKEKIALMDVLRFFLTPDKTKFRTILSKF